VTVGCVTKNPVRDRLQLCRQHQHPWRNCIVLDGTYPIVRKQQTAQLCVAAKQTNTCRLIFGTVRYVYRHCPLITISPSNNRPINKNMYFNNRPKYHVRLKDQSTLIGTFLQFIDFFKFSISLARSWQHAIPLDRFCYRRIDFEVHKLSEYSLYAYQNWLHLIPLKRTTVILVEKDRRGSSFRFKPNTSFGAVAFHWTQTRKIVFEDILFQTKLMAY